jgi:uncharacterized protein YjbI with pentapeptide repeats
MDWFDVLQSVISGIFLGLVAYLLDERRAKRDRKLSDFRTASNWSATEPRISLRGFDLAKSNLSGCKFVGANLEEASFKHSKMWATNFSQANLRRADFRNSTIVGAKYVKSVALLADFSKAVIKSRKDLDYEYLPDFSEATLVYSKFRNTRLEGVSVVNADLKGADFTGATVLNCDFSGSNLAETKWRRVRRVENCLWKDVKLSGSEDLPPFLREEIQQQNTVIKRKHKRNK